MDTHFWKLNAFLNPEMLDLGQKAQIPLLASLLFYLPVFISPEAKLTQEDLGRRHEALNDPSQCLWKIKDGIRSLTFVQATATDSVPVWLRLFSVQRGFLCFVVVFPWLS